MHQEYAIALAENAVDNGVELRIRREVTDIASTDEGWKVTLNHWEPSDYVEATTKPTNKHLLAVFAATVVLCISGLAFTGKAGDWRIMAGTLAVILSSLVVVLGKGKSTNAINFANFSKVVESAGRAIGLGGTAVEVSDMLVGGSGSSRIQKGVTVETETVRAQFIVNCAGGASDKIARMIGDDSFYIKPRMGDYILLNLYQVRSVL
jgi:L-2-hydroxyglutarate oxidase LhgO